MQNKKHYFTWPIKCHLSNLSPTQNKSNNKNRKLFIISIKLKSFIPFQLVLIYAKWKKYLAFFSVSTTTFINVPFFRLLFSLQTGCFKKKDESTLKKLLFYAQLFVMEIFTNEFLKKISSYFSSTIKNKITKK
jgi:hypothetical protein